MIAIPGLPWARLAIAAAALAAAWGWGYWSAWKPAHDREVAAAAIAAEQDRRYRTLEKEASDAQATIIEQYTAARSADRAEWDRIRMRLAARGNGVPPVHPEPGGPHPDPRDGLETPCRPGDRDLSIALVDALEVGEHLERTLQVCQAELRVCAGLR